jgi:hypothetical protein
LGLRDFAIREMPPQSAYCGGAHEAGEPRDSEGLVGHPIAVSGPEAGTFFSMSSPSSHRLLSVT